jgi:hypothetical protein
MTKRYELIVRVLLAEATDDPTVGEDTWRTEEVSILGTLDDLATMLNANGASQAAKQMAMRLVHQQRQGDWTD